MRKAWHLRLSFLSSPLCVLGLCHPSLPTPELVHMHQPPADRLGSDRLAELEESHLDPRKLVRLAEECNGRQQESRAELSSCGLRGARSRKGLCYPRSSAGSSCHSFGQLVS